MVLPEKLTSNAIFKNFAAKIISMEKEDPKEVEIKIKEILGQNFVKKEKFLSGLKRYVKNPYYWLGYFSEIIAEVATGKYFILRDVLYEKAKTLEKRIKESKEDKLTLIKKYVQEEVKEISSEDINLITAFLEGYLFIFENQKPPNLLY